MDSPSASANRPQPGFTFFHVLPLETRLDLVEDHADYPTRHSFFRTCTQYHETFKNDSDCYRVVDECAALGYKALLEDCMALKASLDEKTSLVAASHGQVEILELYIRERKLELIKDIPTKIPKLVLDWTCQAALAGNRRTLQWVRFDEWKDPEQIFEVKKSAALGGQLVLARDIHRRHPAAQGHLNLFEKEMRKAHLQALCIFHQLDGQEGYSQEFVKEIFELGMRNYRPEFLSWSLEKNPELLTTENMNAVISLAAPHGSTDLLELAVQRGAVLDIQDFFHRTTFAYHIICNVKTLQYLHAKLGVTSAPDQGPFMAPVYSIEALEWMSAQGYQFDRSITFGGLVAISQEPAVICWMIQHGFKVCLRNILDSAYHRQLEILDQVWNINPAALSPDSKEVPKWLDYMAEKMTVPPYRFSALRFTCIIKWLCEKGLDRSLIKCSKMMELLKKKKRMLYDDLVATL